MKNVLIIGGGIGGIATGIRLLNRGYRVKILEKEGSLGGKVNIIKRDGFRFDLTASISMMHKEYEEIFNSVEKNAKDYYCSSHVDPIYRVFYDDGYEIDFFESLNETLLELEKRGMDSCGYTEYFYEFYTKFKNVEKNFLKRSFEKWWDLFNPKMLKEMWRLKPLSSTYRKLNEYLDDERLKAFLCFQAMYIGVSPFENSNIYTMIPLVSQMYGLILIEGGMYGYVCALEKLFRELGGEIYLNKEVDKIITDGNKATGILCESEFLRGDIIVSNANYHYTKSELLSYGDEIFEDGKNSFSPGVFILYLGLGKKVDVLKVHNIFLTHDYKESISAPFHGKMPENESFYVYVPSRECDGVAPEGCEIINVMMRVPNLKSDIKWEHDYIKSLRDKLLGKIKSVSGLEDIEEHILVEEYLTPLDMKKRFNNRYGEAFSLSHNINQSAWFRPHIKDSKIKNLYFTGESGYPGCGVSLVLMNSKLVAEEIFKNTR